MGTLCFKTSNILTVSSGTPSLNDPFPHFAFLFIVSDNTNKYGKWWLLLLAVENSGCAVTFPPFIISQNRTVKYMFIPFLLWGLGALRALEDPGDPKEANQTQIILKQIIKEIINSKISFSYSRHFFFLLANYSKSCYDNKINGRKWTVCRKNSMHNGKLQVLAGLKAGDWSWAGSCLRVRVTDGCLCLEKRLDSLLCKRITQSIYDHFHSYFSVKATLFLCPSTNLI